MNHFYLLFSILLLLLLSSYFFHFFPRTAIVLVSLAIILHAKFPVPKTTIPSVPTTPTTPVELRKQHEKEL
jgi:hypothetical protein